MTRRAGVVPEETKTRLLRSAVLEFGEYGFEKASLRRICSRAEVTTGALYFFFQDKEDLFRHVIAPVTDRILTMMETHYEKELTIPSVNIVKEESEDFRTAEEFFEIYFANQEVCGIVLNNRENPLVSSFFERLISMMDNQMILLLSLIHPKLPGNRIFNECTIHWFSHLQIDAVLHILSHGLNEAQAKEQLKIMIRLLRGGVVSLLSDAEPGL